VCKALEAGECLRALGYPSLQEAVNLVRDGNIRNVPYGVEDIRRFFDIYGGQIPALRGKTTKRHKTPTTMEDRAAKIQLTNQVMVADVMHVCGIKFLVSVSSPLEVLLVKHLQSLSRESLGAGVQAHIKELIRAVLVDLPYTLPRDRIKDLVTYAVSRINMRSTKALTEEASPSRKIK